MPDSDTLWHAEWGVEGVSGHAWGPSKEEAVKEANKAFRSLRTYTEGYFLGAVEITNPFEEDHDNRT